MNVAREKWILGSLVLPFIIIVGVSMESDCRGFCEIIRY
jgi:hypothetical protein